MILNIFQVVGFITNGLALSVVGWSTKQKCLNNGSVESPKKLAWSVDEHIFQNSFVPTVQLQTSHQATSFPDNCVCRLPGLRKQRIERFVGPNTIVVRVAQIAGPPHHVEDQMVLGLEVDPRCIQQEHMAVHRCPYLLQKEMVMMMMVVMMQVMMMKSMTRTSLMSRTMMLILLIIVAMRVMMMTMFIYGNCRFRRRCSIHKHFGRACWSTSTPCG